MKLSTLLHESQLSFEVKRDGEFASLGYVQHDMPAMLVFLDHEKFIERVVNHPTVACVITTPELASHIPDRLGVATTDTVRPTFFHSHNYLATTDFYWQDFENDISDEAVIHPSVTIAPRNVKIGRGTVIEPGVVIMERTIIGEDCTLRANSVFGTHGFEFKRFGKEVLRVAHAGGTLLYDRVEVQNLTNVNRSVFGGFTEIGDDSKIDTLVHIGHNAKIGKRVLIAANAMIAGCTIGDDVWIGPSATTVPGAIIGEGAYVSVGAVVTKNVEPHQQVSGNFAIEHKKFLEFIRSIR